MKKFAVVLAGCGVYDGAEIHEATLSLLAIAESGNSYSIFAPDIEQHHVINHLNGKEMEESRNVLVEAARIARGNISPLSEFNADDFDGLLFPGGFGVAKNLSNWAFKGDQAILNTEVKASILSMIEQKKPVGALCISPVLLAKSVEAPQLTIGSDEDTIKALEAAGANHVQTTHGEVVVDEKYLFVTTPCYMLDATISEIAIGAEKVVKEMLSLMH